MSELSAVLVPLGCTFQPRDLIDLRIVTMILTGDSVLPELSAPRVSLCKVAKIVLPFELPLSALNSVDGPMFSMRSSWQYECFDEVSGHAGVWEQSWLPDRVAS